MTDMELDVLSVIMFKPTLSLYNMFVVLSMGRAAAAVCSGHVKKSCVVTGKIFLC